MALELGWPGGVEALRREMSYREWREWVVYYKLEAQRHELEEKKAKQKAGRR